ncbi:MAG: hypothetical protein M1549_03150 [Candidatus Dependentiae bacterium]|nr:hypothetical protein [Candidatus Dependentiae bacterium]
MERMSCRIGVVLYLSCLGGMKAMEQTNPPPIPNDNQYDKDVQAAQTKLCPLCELSCEIEGQQYGCLHSEHPLCLYESLALQGMVHSLPDLVNWAPGTTLVYRCGICHKKHSLDFFVRNSLYQDCIEKLSSTKLSESSLSLIDLPRHLANKTIHGMPEGERLMAFQELVGTGLGWQFLSKLSPAEWPAYIASLPKNCRKTFGDTMPDELHFMGLTLDERRNCFENQKTCTQRKILVSCWPDLKVVEQRDYLTALLARIDLEQKAPLKKRACLFAELVSNHQPAPTEICKLLEEILAEVSAPQQFSDLAYFFIPQLDQTAVYLCLKKVFEYLTVFDKALLLSSVAGRLESEEKECELLDLTLESMTSTQEFHAVLEAINELTPPHAQRWTDFIMETKIKTMEDGAALLLDVWDALNTSAQEALAKKALKKSFTAKRGLKNTCLLLKELPTRLAYLYAEKICMDADSSKEVAPVLKPVYPRLKLGERLKIVALVCKNPLLHPSPKECAHLLAGMPHDTVMASLAMLFEKFALADEQAELLVNLGTAFSPKQRIALIKEFAQKRPVPFAALHRIIAAFAIAHMPTYKTNRSLFHNFFGTLKPMLDDLFPLWLKSRGIPLFETIWPLIPEGAQETYFAHMPPKKRGALCDHLAGKDDQLQRLKSYGDNLVSWWLKRPEAEKLAFWDAVPVEAQKSV